MRYIIYLLVVGSLVGYNYKIVTGFTWADVMCLSLLLISIVNHIQRRWKMDRLCRLSALYLPCMLAAAIINSELTNTIFINYFRNYLWGGLVYNALSNSIHSMKDIKWFLLFATAFIAVFLFNFRDMMTETQYNTINTLDFGYGRNNVAFTALLLAIVFEFLYYAKITRAYILLGVVLMAIIIVFCASRYAMIMLLISFFIYRINSNIKIRLSEIFSYVVFICIAIVIYNYVIGFIDTSFFEYSREYLNQKISRSGEDFYDTRIVAINVQPISDLIMSENKLALLFGVPEAIQHSFFSHTLITTGVIGCLCYLITQIKVLTLTYRFKGVYIFLFIVVLVMFLNDFITNARFIVGVNSMLYGVICAILYKYIQINEDTSISFRIHR